MNKIISCEIINNVASRKFHCTFIHVRIRVKKRDKVLVQVVLNRRGLATSRDVLLSQFTPEFGKTTGI